MSQTGGDAETCCMRLTAHYRLLGITACSRPLRWCMLQAYGMQVWNGSLISFCNIEEILYAHLMHTLCTLLCIQVDTLKRSLCLIHSSVLCHYFFSFQFFSSLILKLYLISTFSTVNYSLILVELEEQNGITVLFILQEITSSQRFQHLLCVNSIMCFPSSSVS